MSLVPGLVMLLLVLSVPVRSMPSEKLKFCRYFTKGTFSPIMSGQKISRRQNVLRKSSSQDQDFLTTFPTIRSGLRQRELILTEKIDIEYSMRYETLALRTVSDI